MSLFNSFQISGSALTAEKLRLDVIAGNLANMQTTRTAAGGPYRRRTVVFAEALAAQGVRGAGPNGAAAFTGRGVRVEQVYADQSEPQLVYDPDHPDAGEDGYVRYPNIELAREMTDMITALRSYEANSTAVNTAKSLYLKALEIGR
jgi:flagellar basal-body rod protein FlgC